ncbi:MAG TPA: CotH kinase family protein, partial [Prolixibacteraceae bacterium]|nr:CotH kinase family protein [Prolixibacteraceae bacterium]
MSSNREVVFDEDNDAPDWIEIINTAEAPISLADYFLSDNPGNLLKWQLPEMDLAPQTPLLIFASDKDRRTTPTHWYSILQEGDGVKYITPKSAQGNDWKLPGFNENDWIEGVTGIGYGDEDDNTVLEDNVISVFIRKSFQVKNAADVNDIWLHMDFDDGFVAYLNGVEIAREGLGSSGTDVPFNEMAASHEAQMYAGQKPNAYHLSGVVGSIKTGENILAVQVHNTGINSSDLTAIPFLTIGFATPQENYKPVPGHIQLSTGFSHTNFKLSSSGETVFLTHRTTGITDSVTYNVIPGEFSYGRLPQPPYSWGFFQIPTPGGLNNEETYTGIVEKEVQFSIEEMLMGGADYLELSGAAGDEVIRFTTEGEKPSINSTVYTKPILINQNSVIKAAIFKAGFLPGKTISRTYIFGNESSLPVVSVSLDPEDLWDREKGIYVLGDEYESDNPYYGANFWEDWEKPANIEYAEPNGERLFSMNCGIKIFGGWSRAHPQKSLSVFFRNMYRDPELKDVQLFQNKPVDEFKSLVLRNSGNDFGFSKIRDAMMTGLVSDMDIDYAAYRPVVLYLNGKYWGLINLREKLNEDYLESNHKFDADSIDILEWHGSVMEGNSDEYWGLWYYLENNSLEP